MYDIIWSKKVDLKSDSFVRSHFKGDYLWEQHDTFQFLVCVVVKMRCEVEMKLNWTGRITFNSTSLRVEL
jgi:hypothetical protein